MNNQIYKYSFSIIRYKVAFEYLSSQIVAITIILTSVYITFHMYSRKAEENAISGSSSEKEVENYNSDISSIANYIRTLQQNRIANIKEINEEQAREVRYLGQNKASMDKVQIQNGVNIANTIQSFTGEETIERDIESLEGRELDIIAEIDRSESSTEQIRKMCQDEEKQFYSDMEKIQVICQDLFNLNKKVQSSDELRTYIRQFTITLSQTLMQNFENEKNARKHYMEYIVFYENIETPLKHSITEIQRNINNIYNDYKQMKKRFQSNFSSVNFFLSEINQYLIHYRDLYEKIHNEEEKKEHSHLISVLSSLEKEFNETCKLFEENYKKLTLLIKNLNSLLLIFQKNIKLLKQYELNIRNNLGKLTTNLSQLTIINYTSPYLNSVLYEFLSNIQNELKKHFSDFSDMFQKDNELFLLIEQMDKNHIEILNIVRDTLLTLKELNTLNETLKDEIASLFNLETDEKIISLQGLVKQANSFDIFRGDIFKKRKQAIDEANLIDRINAFDLNEIQRIQQSLENWINIRQLNQAKINYLKQIIESYTQYFTQLISVYSQNQANAINEVSSNLSKEIKQIDDKNIKLSK